MKIISWNVNGLRAVHRKNLFLDWADKSKADFICLQETKLQEPQIPAEIQGLKYHSYYNSAIKPGYSGVAIYAKTKPQHISNTFGLDRFDQEGRFMRLDYPNFSLINLYLPHGGRKQENIKYKLKSYDYLLQYISKNKLKNLILCGDFNIARSELDLARPKQNLNNTMFTPDERAKIQQLLDAGFIDTFRAKNPKEQKFTWWPYFANARARDLGWRIDYIFISKSLKPTLKIAGIATETPGSDHCPVEIEITA